MKIVGLETFVVPPRWLFAKIETDEGIAGWGEPILEGHAEACAAGVMALEDFLIGRDPLAIEDTWQAIYRSGCYRGGPIMMSVLSGIDMALWDIKGKYLGVPVHSLYGGPVRNKVRSYCWVSGDRPEKQIERTKALMAAGFDACKMNICGEMQIVDSMKKVDEIVRNLGELRDAVGWQMDLAFDFHGRIHAPMSKILLKELEAIRPLFVEDAVTPDHLDALAELARSTSIPLVTGERLHSRYAFKAVFENRAAGVINPDTAHVGGISEMVRIGAMAEAYDIGLAPHCPIGPIALAACLQVDAICYNAFIQEQSLGIHYNAGGDLLDYVAEGTFAISRGYLDIPKAPGLGVEVDEAVVRERAADPHRWRPPLWRHEDGSVAEW